LFEIDQMFNNWSKRWDFNNLSLVLWGLLLYKVRRKKLWLYLGHGDIGVGTNMVSPLEMLLEILVFSVIILRIKLKE
jgi:hypothetical protein